MRMSFLLQESEFVRQQQAKKQNCEAESYDSHDVVPWTTVSTVMVAMMVMVHVTCAPF